MKRKGKSQLKDKKSKLVQKNEKYFKAKAKKQFQDKKKMKSKKQHGNLKNRNFQFSPGLSWRKLKQMPLRERMLEKLKSARFRYINEQLYVNQGRESMKYFFQDKEAFKAYHEGYQTQVQQWPINPVNVIINSLKSLVKKNTVIADFGCGTADIAQTFSNNQVHSYDFVALNPHVTVCDMSHTPLENDSVDILVFCLSLMGTNLNEFLIEANRVLKTGGVMKIAEVESRFENVENFIRDLIKFGFKNTFKDFTHNLFYFMDFRKVTNMSKNSKKKLPCLSLKPCLYKKR